MATIVSPGAEYYPHSERIEPKSIYVSEDHYNELVEDQKLINALKTAFKRLTT